MALIIQKRAWKNQDGTVTRSWRFVIEEFKNGKKRSIYPKKAHYPHFGLDASDDYETALEKLKTIRAKDKIEKTAERRARIDLRLAEEDLKESAYLPRKLFQRFTEWLADRRLWGEIPSKSASHIRCMRRLVLELNMDPSEWPNKPEKVYKWFVKNKLSKSYLKKTLPLVNEYGYFYCREFNKPFLRIPFPRGEILRRIEDANLEERSGRQAASAPMTESVLSRLQDLPDPQLRWLRLAFWFGLRPSEVDELRPENRERSWGIYGDSKGTPILKFYQTKLTSVDRDRRWKRIPALFKEQRDLLVELKHEMKVQRPLLKTIEARIGGQYGLYAGRKGFEKLMRERGQQFQNISRWLGHRDLKRTEDHYRETEAVEYDPPSSRGIARSPKRRT